MILSASRRTDIPAFFHEWFFNRINEGFLYVRNPMNPQQVSKIILSPDIVDCIVFWTKNPLPMIKDLHRISNYDYYFQYTLNGYGKKLEPGVSTLDSTINTFIKLSNLIGRERVVWRYDPIILNDEYNIDYHEKTFRYIAEAFSGKTEKCIISFVHPYKKTIKNMKHIKLAPLSENAICSIYEKFKKTASSCNIKLTSCGEESDLSAYGIPPGRCIDDELIKHITGFDLDLGRDKNQRKRCRCIESIDIGSYNTCLHNCLYCYANYDMSLVRRNYSMHNPESPLLFGNIERDDKISERNVRCNKIYQQTLF